MGGRTASEVFIAGNIYVKRALVRRFLEDDGFEVVGEARNREDMVDRDPPRTAGRRGRRRRAHRGRPRRGHDGRLRRAAPDAKVVVFTSTPVDPASAPADADGYLEKGLGLASLTALLGRLFAHPADRIAASRRERCRGDRRLTAARTRWGPREDRAAGADDATDALEDASRGADEGIAVGWARAVATTGLASTAARFRGAPRALARRCPEPLAIAAGALLIVVGRAR